MLTAKMQSILQGASSIVLLILATFLLGGAHPAVAQAETVLHSFANNGTDGSSPYAPLALDTEDNLYGTTYGGGTNGDGTVFKVTPYGSETILHSFAGAVTDGCKPYFAGVVLDKAGTLYGTTNGCGAHGYGTVYKLTQSGTETTLHSFGSTDGEAPFAGVVLDEAGNIYGTTNGGGTHRCGTVYKLTQSGTETILHSFGGPTEGCFPMGGVVLGKNNVLYGTTFLGGAHGYGTVYKLAQSGSETTLHSFAGGVTDGTYPEAGVVLDEAGNIYGTTNQGGAHHYGIVFKLTPSGAETVLHNFGSGTDGADPDGAGVILDKSGNLYGATLYGGANGRGTVFEINSTGTETLLHSFAYDGLANNGTDGFSPVTGVVLGKMNTLYGTTYNGGTNGAGTVFKVVTIPSGTFTSNVPISVIR
jgi:uncharacterized repeat protein (TIGR03803 family)